MNCDELLPLLALLALGERDGLPEAEARDHLSLCERCSARLRDLERTRAALDLAAVPESAPLPGAAIRAAAFREVRPVGPALSRLLAAAAALLLFAAGAGFLGGRLAGGGSDEADEIPPAALARALVALEQRVVALELRHDEDLVALAKAVDRQQLRRDQGFADRIETLARATRAELTYTRSALDDVARLVLPALAVVPATDRH